MALDLACLYGKFVEYVTCLHKDLDDTVSQRIPPEYRAQLLSYEDFRYMWRRWGDTEGLQETWRRRFEQGYYQAALDLSRRVDAALGGRNPASREAA